MASTKAKLNPYLIALIASVAGGSVGYTVAPMDAPVPGVVIPDRQPGVQLHPVSFLAELSRGGRSYWYYLEADWDQSYQMWKVSKGHTTPRIYSTIVTLDWIKANGGFYLDSQYLHVYNSAGSSIGLFAVPIKQRQPTGDAPIGQPPKGSVGKAPPDA